MSFPGRFFFVLCTFSASLANGATDTPPPSHTVLWISIDGFRADYLERADMPFLNELREKSAFSDAVSPVFPSVTFPSHVSQATGVKPEQHGITGNTFYDTKTDKIHRYPGDAALLQAEPIWITATRQGVRSLVLDWPLSHNQTGPATSAYFLSRFDSSLSDRERLARLLDQWKQDDDPQPLRLILGYASSLDSAGHRHGPDSPKTLAAAARIDRLLAETFERALRLWQTQRTGPDDRFFFLVSSDHGMSEVTTLVHPEHLTGLANTNGVLTVSTGNIAHVFFNKIAHEDDRETTLNETLARLSGYSFVRAFRRESIPAKWGMQHPTRTGDLFLVLDNGYAFSYRPDAILSAKEAGEPLGMHGYDPAPQPIPFPNESVK